MNHYELSHCSKYYWQNNTTILLVRAKARAIHWMVLMVVSNFGIGMCFAHDGDNVDVDSWESRHLTPVVAISCDEVIPLVRDLSRAVLRTVENLHPPYVTFTPPCYAVFGNIGTTGVAVTTLPLSLHKLKLDEVCMLSVFNDMDMTDLGIGHVNIQVGVCIVHENNHNADRIKQLVEDASKHMYNTKLSVDTDELYMDR